MCEGLQCSSSRPKYGVEENLETNANNGNNTATGSQSARLALDLYLLNLNILY